jgi:acylaminoacyl-peptidase
VCADGTFGGVSWSAREGRIAYVAEAPVGEDGPTPEWGMGVTTTTTAAKKKESEDAAAASNKKGWRGRGEWREEWGEQLVGKTSPACFVLECATGEVTEVSRVGLPEGSVAASGPIWAPADEDDESDALVLPTWSGDIENFKSTSRRLGLTFCFNRPSEMFLMDVPAPRVPAGSGAGGEKTPTPTPTPTKKKNPAPPTRLAKGDVSALWPRFTPDGTALVFISHAAAVESGAHNATCALRKIAWTPGVGPQSEASDVVVPVVRCVLYTGPHTTAFAW